MDASNTTRGYERLVFAVADNNLLRVLLADQSGAFNCPVRPNHLLNSFSQRTACICARFCPNFHGREQFAKTTFTAYHQRTVLSAANTNVTSVVDKDVAVMPVAGEESLPTDSTVELGVQASRPPVYFKVRVNHWSYNTHAG